MNPCVIKQMSKDEYCMECNILPTNLGLEKTTALSQYGRRPEACDDSVLESLDPYVAYMTKANMSNCSYHHHYMHRCGCEELDIKKHPEI